MHPIATDLIVKEVIQRASEGDCPAIPARSVGQLEDVIIDLTSRLALATPAVILAQGQPSGTPSVEHLQELLRQRDVDISNLISELRALEQATGESLEDEDAALVAHIEKDLRVREEIREAVGSAAVTPQDGMAEALKAAAAGEFSELPPLGDSKRPTTPQESLGWSPIGTAPKDGRTIEVKYLTDDPRKVRWSQSRHGTCWHLATTEQAVPLLFAPTDWRPILSQEVKDR